MSKVTTDRLIRMKFKHPDGRLLDSIPRVIKRCAVCFGEMLVSEDQNAKWHKCCRKYRHNTFYAHEHIANFHNPNDALETMEKLSELAIKSNA